jgi:ATP-dependent helicase Lhr and Lhr-like helicase
VVIPDHPLVRQTMHDCLTEAMDVERWIGILTDIKEGKIQLVPRDTREPSPFSHELLNANPYAFLDGAPLEERRTRAVQTRRSSNPEDFRDLARLDPAAIAQVAQEAWPLVRDAEELHDALLNLVVVHAYELESWNSWLPLLIAAGRAAQTTLADGTQFIFAAENWRIVQAAHPTAVCVPSLQLSPELNQPLEAHQAWVELVRGRTMHSGPQTAEALAALLSLEPSQVSAACEALEAEGLLMRGQFTPAAWANQEAGRNSEWCERRLLARVHRLTLAGLRKSISAVEPEDYWHFLAQHHALLPKDRRDGPAGLRTTLEQLEGFEIAAGAWERFVMPARLSAYDVRWLDELFLNGELTWGRLARPQRETGLPATAMLTRTAPLSFLFRERMSSLLRSNPTADIPSLRSGTAALFQLLESRGALFQQEMTKRTGLLPTQVEEALRELAALGLITSDTFAAVRTLTQEKKQSRRRPGSRNLHAGAGRWSLFPGSLDAVERSDQLQAWCYLLLRRYGVVFRDILARESAAPAWTELVPWFRKLELRGEVRGGRFIARVSGEQYGLESTISKLRAAREQRTDAGQADQWCVISAVDPLNLAGIITPGTRVTANPKTSLVLKQGECVAVKQSGQIEFLTPLPGEQQYAMRRALQIGYRENEATQPAPLHVRTHKKSP